MHKAGVIEEELLIAVGSVRVDESMKQPRYCCGCFVVGARVVGASVVGSTTAVGGHCFRLYVDQPVNAPVHTETVFKNTIVDGENVPENVKPVQLEREVHAVCAAVREA